MKIYTLETGSSFESQECISCGVAFFIPNILGNQLRKNKNLFFCPNGHSMSYAQSESDRLKKQLEEKQAECERAYKRITDLTKPMPKRRAMRKAV